MKVYVYTKAKPLALEEYIGVKGSKKEAEKALRQRYPHMKLASPSAQLSDTISAYVSDVNADYLLFIHEEII